MLRCEFAKLLGTPFLWSTSGGCFCYWSILQVYWDSSLIKSHSLANYTMKSNFFNLICCEYATVHFGTYLTFLPLKCMHKMICRKKEINYTSIFRLYQLKRLELIHVTFIHNVPYMKLVLYTSWTYIKEIYWTHCELVLYLVEKILHG